MYQSILKQSFKNSCSCHQFGSNNIYRYTFIDMTRKSKYFRQAMHAPSDRPCSPLRHSMAAGLSPKQTDVCFPNPGNYSNNTNCAAVSVTVFTV